MKTRIINHLIIALTCILISNNSYSQLTILQADEVSPEEMVALLIGPGVTYDSVHHIGVPVSRGIFQNGSSTNIGINEGIFLTSGNGLLIPGPNTTNSASQANNSAGYPLLDSLTTQLTHDASILEFNFIPLNDTIKCNFVFGSEEYNEYVNSSFNDVFGFFVSGPNPDGGMYEAKNIALVPNSNQAITINTINNGAAAGGVVPTGPCTNCEYFIDNTFGLTIQYDGFTTVLTAWVLVLPGEVYNFKFGVADVEDGILDSGVFMEGESFKSLGPGEFFSFDFLKENNPNLPYDLIGEIYGTNVSFQIPEGTDINNLIATWENQGIEVYVDNLRQENNVTPNDFSQPVSYHLEGYSTSDWVVMTDIISDIDKHPLSKISIGPNPSNGNISIEVINGASISIYTSVGLLIYHNETPKANVAIHDLQAGIYFIRFEKDGFENTRKIVVN